MSTQLEYLEPPTTTDPHVRQWYIVLQDALTRLRALQELTLNGSGDPEGAVAAPVGTLFLRSDGGAVTTLYVKETGGAGNTGWAAK